MHLRSYQGSVGCPGTGVWTASFEKDVRARQLTFLDDPKWLGALLHWCLNHTRRAWSNFSLYKCACAKAGEAAILACVEDLGKGKVSSGTPTSTTHKAKTPETMSDIPSSIPEAPKE